MDDLERFNLTNYRHHPTDQRYMVYSFKSKEKAEDFEARLKEHGVDFEKDADAGIILYGIFGLIFILWLLILERVVFFSFVHRSDLKKAVSEWDAASGTKGEARGRFFQVL